MDKKIVVSALAAAITEAAASGNDKRMEFASSLLSAYNRGNPSPKQMACIERIVNGDPETAWNPAQFLAAFTDATRLTKKPRIEIEVEDVKWEMVLTPADSTKAKPENRGTVALTAGKYGTPENRYGGRLTPQGFTQGKDYSPALDAALAALDPAALPWAAK